MFKLFGKAKEKPPATAPQESAQKIAQTQEMLEKKTAHLRRLADQQNEELKKFLLAKNKNAAMMCLKKKKMYEAEADKTNQFLMNLQHMAFALQGANLRLEAVQAMKEGAAGLKAAHNAMGSVDKVDDVMDEVEEQMQANEEITEALSRPIMGDKYGDEDELAAELEQLEAQAMESQMLGAGAPPVAAAARPQAVAPAMGAPAMAARPSAPAMAARGGAAYEDPDEAELRQLEASMAM